MDIYIPKHKEIYIKDGEMAMGGAIKGEYRAILYGSDGRVKHDSGWHPNTTLNQGLYYYCLFHQDSYAAGKMHLGDSDIPVDITQVGIQGLQIGTNQDGGIVMSNAVNSGSPDYSRAITGKFTFLSGNGIGLIKEVGMSMWGDAINGCSTRFVLNTPINKQASDQLAIQWRQTYYPRIEDVTGTIDISGVPYDFTMRHHTANSTPNWLIGGTSPHVWYNYHRLYYGDLALITEPISTNAASRGSANVITGGHVNAATPYGWSEHTWNVDSGNGSVNMLDTTTKGLPPIQTRFVKSSDGTSLVKLNTHELVLNVRTYVERYVP